MKQITLRALEPQDIEAIYRWENDPQVWEQSYAHTPFSKHALKQYIVDATLTDIYASRQLRLMAMDGEKPVGCVDLSSFDPYHQRAEVGIVVDALCRNQGYGRAIIEALIPFCKKSLRLHQLYCDIDTDNEASIAMFESCGFMRKGIKADWIQKDGHWSDAYFYSLIID